MNLLRTIQQEEDPAWIDFLFKEGPHVGHDVPQYPPSFPLSFELHQDVKGEYLYVVYRAKIIGYGPIREVFRRHAETEVGSDGQIVEAGDLVVVDGALQRMPFSLPCQGFPNVRYTAATLHELSPAAALAEIQKLNLMPV